MADTVEEEELAHHKGLDKHHEGCRDDRQKADDVTGANDVEGDPAHVAHISLEERHLRILSPAGASNVHGKQ